MVALKPRELTRWSGNTTNVRRGVGLVAIHESVGLLNALDLAAYCERTGTSYHATADNTQMVYTVPRSLTAWHLRNGNPYADGLCLTTPTAGYSRNEWLTTQVNKVSYAAWWIAGVCADRNVKIERCSQNDIRAVLAGDTSRGGVIGHVDYTYATGDGTHTDPRNFPFDVAIQWAKDLSKGSSLTPVPLIENKVKDNDMHLELPPTTARKDFQVLFGPVGGWDGDAVLHLAANTGPDATVYWIGAITNRGATPPLITDLVKSTDQGKTFVQWWKGIYNIPKDASGVVISYKAQQGMTGCIERSK